jgi:hypothetical protein
MGSGVFNVPSGRFSGGDRVEGENAPYPCLNEQKGAENECYGFKPWCLEHESWVSNLVFTTTGVYSTKHS